MCDGTRLSLHFTPLLIPPWLPLFFSYHSFIFSNPYSISSHHFLLSISLALFQSILGLGRDALHSQRALACFYFILALCLPLQSRDYLQTRHGAVEIEFWSTDLSIFTFRSCVLTKTALIEIQPHALPPAKCP